MSLRIVVPVLNEGAALRARLQALAPLRQRGAEVVVVDGGSTDATWAAARGHCDLLLCAPPGRAAQMNAGAAGAKTQALLFLHADTRLPEQADALIAQALAAAAHWGRFDVQLDSARFSLQLVQALMNWRSRLSGVSTGDQALFVRREVFERIGGFADIPLMEDIEICKRLKRLGAPANLGARAVTSARRWERFGVWRTIFLMWRLRAAYFFGAAPAALAQRYGYSARPQAVQGALALLAKAPVPGYAKTRLAPLLGETGAARVQRRLCLDALATARASGLGLTLWCAPDTNARFFRALARRTGVHCETQVEGDLGQRMHHICQNHFAAQPGVPLLLMGADCPLLSPGLLHQAVRMLSQCEAVIIPAQDGGYVLIGFARELPLVFQNISWSTPVVLAQTRGRLRELGATWSELPTQWDIDEPEDWQRWQRWPEGERR